MSQDWGRDGPDLEKLYARKLWADFSFPRGKNLGHSDLDRFARTKVQN